ncbi:MAG: hypothetical protein QOI99_1303 [Actinomycetota bacterium]|nr:hypothetical protein [Actinomycetota bacterium]
MVVKNPQTEARIRINNRYDARVLEPSPPAVNEGPWFADDPVAGGELVPVERPGTRTWADFCTEINNAELWDWCGYRWLVPRKLDDLPAKFAPTREALHRVAEHLIAPRRHMANGKIGLRFTFRGFGTPFFDDDHQVRVEDGELVDRNRRRKLTTLAAAAEFLGVELGSGTGVYTPTTPCDPEAALDIDFDAARALGEWFGFTTAVLEQLREEAGEDDAPSRVQLWPEHFDVAVDLGPEGNRANFGGSPGDAEHAEPYLYVGPWDRRAREGDLWNEPFGASLSYGEIQRGADPLDFLRRGKVLTRG